MWVEILDGPYAGYKGVLMGKVKVTNRQPWGDLYRIAFGNDVLRFFGHEFRTI